jgi:hypothetical protein
MIDSGPGKLGGDWRFIFSAVCGITGAPFSNRNARSLTNRPLRSIVHCHPTCAGSACIASNTRATMSTLQAVAPIPAFIARSML